MDIIEALNTGGDAAAMALLLLVWKQSQIIASLKERIIRLETHLSLITERK